MVSQYRRKLIISESVISLTTSMSFNVQERAQMEAYIHLRRPCWHFGLLNYLSNDTKNVKNGSETKNVQTRIKVGFCMAHPVDSP